jgi:2-oxoglutarate ferredoxin oxidoreductase subunit alpha
MITARQLAETFNMVVVVLTDANLATAQQPIPRPEFSEEWLAPPVDQSAVPKDAKPYDWDPKTGLAPRFVPGRPDGMHCLTGLAHDQNSKVIYDPEINEQAIEKRSLKLAALQKTLKPPPIFGGDQGDLLIIGWGSTKGAIEEAIERVRADGFKASSVHLQFLQPLASGLKEIMDNFEKVVIVENSWSDKLENEMIDENNRRFSNLAWLIRGRYLVDADCWSEVKGRPSKPGAIEQMIRDRLQ